MTLHWLPSQADLGLAKELSVISPYGIGNPAPLFAWKKISLEKITLMGKEQKVMRFCITEENGSSSELISFSHKEALQSYIENNTDIDWQQLITNNNHKPIWLDIIYTLGINEYNGQVRAQLQLKDFRPSDQEVI